MPIGCSRHNPTVESLRRHNHFVKNLTYHTGMRKAYDPLRYPNLSSLTVRTKEDVVLYLYQYGQLRDLEIHGDIIPALRPVWKPAHPMPNLLSLKIDQMDIHRAATEVFWDLCTRLHSLDIQRTGIARLPGKSMKFERLLRLNVSLQSEHTYDQVLDWITQCPNLTELHWGYTKRRTAPCDTFANRVANGTWPGLNELRLKHFYQQEANPARIAQGMRQIRTLCMNGYRFGMTCLTALRPHFDTLRVLNIKFDSSVAGPAFSEILASCPHLEDLTLSRVTSQDIIQGRPWVCGRSMRVLRLNVMISPGQDTDRHQQLVLERVSQLVNLVSLTLDHYSSLQSACLCLRLGKGLEQLSTLKHLMRLSIINYHYELAQADVQETIKAIDDRVALILKEAGVSANNHTTTYSALLTSILSTLNRKVGPSQHSFS
ncbi:hypothetical protein BGX34_004962 [Mortierella sp. NVP85]|nr:hypothetical protein BGX34_004962 [Mortierella sp. NVP85]